MKPIKIIPKVYRATKKTISTSIKIVIFSSVLSIVLKEKYLQKGVAFTSQQIHERVVNKRQFFKAKEKYINEESEGKSIPLNKETKLSDFIEPPKVEVQVPKKSKIIIQLPKVSEMTKSGFQKVKSWINKGGDQSDQSDQVEDKIILEIIKTVDEIPSKDPKNQETISLEDILEEYRDE